MQIIANRIWTQSPFRHIKTLPTKHGLKGLSDPLKNVRVNVETALLECVCATTYFVHYVTHFLCIGLAITVYTWYIYGISGREITKYTVIIRCIYV